MQLTFGLALRKRPKREARNLARSTTYARFAPQELTKLISSSKRTFERVLALVSALAGGVAFSKSFSCPRNDQDEAEKPAKARAHEARTRKNKFNHTPFGQNKQSFKTKTQCLNYAGKSAFYALKIA